MIKMITKEERCQEMVSGTGDWGSFHRHQCEKRFTVVQDNKHYCKIHDPRYIKAKQDANTKKWEEKSAKRMARRNLIGMLLQSCKDALEASHDPVVERILMEAVTKAEKVLTSQIPEIAIDKEIR